MEFVRSKDGTHIAFQQCGEGPPLVLVHGASGSHKRWGGVLPELSAEFTVCAIDRRGRGESGDADCYAIEREYEDVAAVVDAMDEPVNLLGHSFGAICTLEASLLTGNIARLVLCEPPVNAPELPAELSARMQGMLDSGDREGVLSTFLSEYAGIPEHELEKMRRSPAWPARIAAAHTLLRESVAVDDYRFAPERFSNVETPTLLVLGGDSPPFYRESLEMIDETLPNSRITVLPGQQHVPMDTAPDLFLREVIDFLQE